MVLPCLAAVLTASQAPAGWPRHQLSACCAHAGNGQAWDTLTWFAALIGMASFLNKFGFISWFSSKVGCLPTQ